MKFSVTFALLFAASLAAAVPMPEESGVDVRALSFDKRDGAGGYGEKVDKFKYKEYEGKEFEGYESNKYPKPEHEKYALKEAYEEGYKHGYKHGYKRGYKHGRHHWRHRFYKHDYHRDRKDYY